MLKYVSAQRDPKNSRLFELGRLLLRFDHVANLIANANNSVMRAAEKLCVADLRCWVRPARHSTADRMRTHR